MNPSDLALRILVYRRELTREMMAVKSKYERLTLAKAARWLDDLLKDEPPEWAQAAIERVKASMERS